MMLTRDEPEVLVKRKNIPTLVYHRVCSDHESAHSDFVVTKTVFQKQMEYLACHDCYTPRLDDLLTGKTNGGISAKRPVILTFDDGYLCIYQNAFPVLQNFGFTAIVFPVTDFSRRTNWWDFKDKAMRAPLLEPHHVDEMRTAGIQFGSHSVNHPSLPCLADDELVEELVRSKQTLEDITKETVSMLAYPYGDVNERVKSAAREAGYSCAFAVNSGPFNFYKDVYEIRRVSVANNSNATYMFSILSGLNAAYKWGKWSAKRLLGFSNQYHGELTDLTPNATVRG